MARRAFIIGSNGSKGPEQLRFAVSDAQKLSTCLTSARCGFTTRSPKAEQDCFDLLRDLSNEASLCGPEDTFLCYFSGHGILDRGELCLVWDAQKEDVLRASLPISFLLKHLRDCKAQNKMLILDCCHAGGAVGMKNAAGIPVQELLVQPDNHLILMAGERLDRIREMEELGGSFLTSRLCAALSSDFADADQDKDQQLSVDDLMLWLGFAALRHNATASPEDRVPVPFLYGQRKGGFYLTQDDWKWRPFELPWPDGSTMVVVSVFPQLDKCEPPPALTRENAFSQLPDEAAVLCLGKHPVTNAQYQEFVSQTGHRPPVGKRLVKTHLNKEGVWDGFSPWTQTDFNAPEQPVVCVSYKDSERYCHWVNEMATLSSARRWTFLPPATLWHQGAFGREHREYDPKVWFSTSAQIHHLSTCPAPIEHSSARTNAVGLSDMIGNVWEWCTGGSEPAMSSPTYHQTAPQLRGGGFLDDIRTVPPYLASPTFNDADLRHFDLGFRVAAMVRVAHLPEEIRMRLSCCVVGSPNFWFSCRQQWIGVTPTAS